MLPRTALAGISARVAARRRTLALGWVGGRGAGASGLPLLPLLPSLVARP